MSSLNSAEPPHPVIGQTIRFFRAQAKLTQEQLAFAADIHPTEICRLEKGKRNPKWETMKRLAEGLGVPIWKMVRHAEELDLRRDDDPDPRSAASS